MPLVSRVQTKASVPILRSLAWRFAGSEILCVHAAGPLTHMTTAARNLANLLPNLPQITSTPSLRPDRPPWQQISLSRIVRYICCVLRVIHIRNSSSTSPVRRVLGKAQEDDGRVCPALRPSVSTQLKRGLYQRVSSHFTHRSTPPAASRQHALPRTPAAIKIRPCTVGQSPVAGA